MKIQTKIFKADDEKHLIFGFASAADVVDLQNDTISAEELESAAYDFVINSRAGSVMHSGKRVADLIESFFISADKALALGVDGGYINHWFVGFRINDESVWNKIKDGTYSMLSIGGTARRIGGE